MMMVTNLSKSMEKDICIPNQEQTNLHGENLMSSMQANIKKQYIIGFLMNMHFISGVLVPFFTDWGGLSLQQALILQSIFTGGIFLMEIPTGILADRIGRKKSMIMSFILTGCATLLYSSVPNFWIFAMSEFIWATGAAFYSGAGDAMTYDSLKVLGKESESKQVFGRIGAVSLFGILISAPLGSLIAAMGGLRWCMAIMSIPMLLACILSSTLIEPPQDTEINDNTSSKKQKGSPLATFKEGYQHLKNSSELKRIAIDFVVVSVTVYFMMWLYQPRLGEIGIDIVYFGIVNAGYIAVEMILMNNYTKIEKWIGSKYHLLKGTSFIIGLCFLLTALTSNPITVILGILLVIGIGFSRPVLSNSYMNKYVPSSHRATILSTIAMMRMGSTMVLNPIVGAGAEINIPLMMIILGGITLLWVFVSPVKSTDLID
jgi:MFS family permease